LIFVYLSICLQEAGLMILFGSRGHFALAFDNTCTKARMTTVTPRLEYTEVLHY